MFSLNSESSLTNRGNSKEYVCTSAMKILYVNVQGKISVAACAIKAAPTKNSLNSGKKPYVLDKLSVQHRLTRANP